MILPSDGAQPKVRTKPIKHRVSCRRRTIDAVRGIGRRECDGRVRRTRRRECERAARAGCSCARKQRAARAGCSRARKPETGLCEYGRSASASVTRHVWGRVCARWGRSDKARPGARGAAVRCSAERVRRASGRGQRACVVSVFWTSCSLLALGVGGVPTFVEPSKWEGLTWTPLSDLERRARSGSSPHQSSEGWTIVATRVEMSTWEETGVRLVTLVHAWSSSGQRTYALHAGGHIAAGRRAGGTRG
jgi:hypothetical protein